jgi:hypothetical protein
MLKFGHINIEVDVQPSLSTHLFEVGYEVGYEFDEVFEKTFLSKNLGKLGFHSGVGGIHKNVIQLLGKEKIKGLESKGCHYLHLCHPCYHLYHPYLHL